MTRPLRWGILGTSFISGVMADAIARNGTSKVHAVAGRNVNTLDEFKAQHNVAEASTSYDTLIEDPTIDLIYIALPNHLHHEYVVKAAAAGKAILCEKSLSIDMAKTTQALEAVQSAGVFFAEGLMYLTHPLIEKILAVLESGILGEVRAINSSYCAAIDQFVNPDSMGTLFNLGCYPLSLVHLVLQHQFGDAIVDHYKLTSTARRGKDGNICESAASIQFENGVVCQVHTAEDYGMHASFTIVGANGSLECLTNPWLPTENNRLAVTIYEEPAEIIEVPATGDGFDYQVSHVLDAVRASKTSLGRPAARPEDSRQIMQMLTDWAESATTRSSSGVSNLQP